MFSPKLIRLWRPICSVPHNWNWPNPVDEPVAMPKSKVSAFLSVLLVFASGAAMGAVGYRLYVVKTVVSPVQAKKKTSPEDFRKLVMSRLKEAVKLNDQQLDEVQKIYDWQGEQFMPVNKKYESQIDQVKHEFDQQRDQIHEAAVAKIKSVL